MIKWVHAECTPLFLLIKLLNKMRNDPFDIILEFIEQMNLSYGHLSFTISKTYLNIYITRFVVLKTALYMYVQINKVNSTYIFVILLIITINLILDVLFAITNYQLLYVY